jgi:threonylcarbamoyladenosine tRNA methylthiotransferase MtaB
MLTLPVLTAGSTPRIRTASIATLGCKLNQAESYRVQLELVEAGVELVPFEQPADLAIVNTCTVTQSADRDARRLLRRAALNNPDAVVVAMGCYAQVAPSEVAGVEGVRLVITEEKERLVPQLKALGFELGTDAASDRMLDPDACVPLPETRVRHFVKVQDGCDDYCTYCIVPFARGHGVSRSTDEIVAEVNAVVARGACEVVLTGVQIGAYGRDRVGLAKGPTDGPGGPLARLVRRVLDETPVTRLRISSIQPQDWPEEFLGLFENPRVCRHLHLPLQAGCDDTLRRMSRRYTTAGFRRMVERVRSTVPDVALTADLIVGFPGESDDDHAASLEFVREMAFADAHVFRFSPRRRTAASRMSGQVSMEMKQARSEQMREVSEASAAAFRRRFVGEGRTVLWEQELDPRGDEGRVFTGVTDNYLRVDVVSQTDLVGALTAVQLSVLHEGRFLAMPVAPLIGGGGKE